MLSQIRSVHVPPLPGQLGLRRIRAFFDQFMVWDGVKGNNDPIRTGDNRLMPSVGWYRSPARPQRRCRIIGEQMGSPLLANTNLKITVAAIRHHTLVAVGMAFGVQQAQNRKLVFIVSEIHGVFQSVSYCSNSLRGNPDCRMMDCSVPIRISSWSGTGTVIVPCGNFFCITMWLPRLRTSRKPCWARIAHTSLPESTRSLTNCHLNLRHKYVLMESLLQLLR